MTIEAPEEDRIGGTDLVVSFRHIGPICVLAMRGGLHAGNLATLESEVDRLGRTSCHQVVLDVSRLLAIDDAGVRVLTGLHHYVRARGGTLTLVGAQPWILEALACTPLGVS